jgi:lysyl-tRNA synthetase class 2
MTTKNPSQLSESETGTHGEAGSSSHSRSSSQFENFGPSPLRGRCISVETTERGTRVSLRSEKGIFAFDCDPTDPEASSLRVGAIIELQPRAKSEGYSLRILTPHRSKNHELRWTHRTLDPRRLHGTRVRREVEKTIRDFFDSRDFIETKTPLLVPCPGMETHIRPLAIDGSPLGQGAPLGEEFTPPPTFLPTSPEFAMKRLLVGGLERIYQLNSAFRAEPFSPMHRPEFTLLEWYRAYANLEAILVDSEWLLHSLAQRIHGQPIIPFNGHEINFAPPWPRLRIRDLFQEELGIELGNCEDRQRLADECKKRGHAVSSDETWDDLYFKLWLNEIEPKLPKDRPVFVIGYPPSQAALAVREKAADGTLWARRFEIYAGGLELGNAFEELTDPVEQRKRFEEDMDLREQIYGSHFPRNPMDEGFLDALNEGMPPSAGIAIGVDRLVMLMANESDIGFTLWLDPVTS